MTQRIKGLPLSHQRGFTILESVAVLAIIAVLAGIVTTSVAGVSGASQDSQALRASTDIGNAAADYFFDRDGVATIIPLELPVLNLSLTVVQEISSRWPEDFVTSIYQNVFPPDPTTTVTEITFLDEDGETLATAAKATDFAVNDILAGFTAVDFSALVAQEYIKSEPVSVGQKSGPFSDYLWLFEKANSAGSPVENASRNVALFKLVVVQKESADTEQASLVYQRIT